jgi:hypothetical protein
MSFREYKEGQQDKEKQEIVEEVKTQEGQKTVAVSMLYLRAILLNSHCWSVSE